MARVKRSLRVFDTDLARVETLRDRLGPRTSASEAVRAALVWFRQNDQALPAIAEAGDRLVVEAEGATPRGWGISMPQEEDEALTELVKRTTGLRRDLSRNELVRVALMLVSSASDHDIKAMSAQKQEAPDSSP